MTLAWASTRGIHGVQRYPGHADGYPQPTPVSTVEDAVSVAAALGAHIAALSCEMNVQLPGHFISGSMVGLPEIIAGEAAKSRRNAQDLIAAFDAATEKFGVSANRSCRNASRSRSRTFWSNMRGFVISRSCRYRSRTINGTPRP